MPLTAHCLVVPATHWCSEVPTTCWCLMLAGACCPVLPVPASVQWPLPVPSACRYPMHGVPGVSFLVPTKDACYQWCPLLLVLSAWCLVEPIAHRRPLVHHTCWCPPMSTSVQPCPPMPTNYFYSCKIGYIHKATSTHFECLCSAKPLR